MIVNVENKYSGGGNNIVLRCDDAVKQRIHISIYGNGNEVIIEENVEVVDCLTIHIVDDNNYVFVGRGTTFEKTDISIADCRNSITIGEDCMFARNTIIMASDFHSIIDLATGFRKNISTRVEIDNHVWVGYGATILKNTHIYSNSIISAGVVVRGDVLANSIYIDSSRKNEEKSEDITWERQRQCKVSPLKIYTFEDRRKFDEVHYNNNILINMENNFTTYFNKVKGWAVWRGKKSQISELYLFCYYLKKGEEKNWIIPLKLYSRKDVALYLGNKDYEFSGFDSYMPSDVINNWGYVQHVDIIMRNGFVCGKRNIFNRTK